MAKLRKMLGSLDDPSVAALMRLIETQSRETLAKWAADYTETHYLPVYEKAFPEEDGLRETLAACKKCAAGEIKLTKLKPLVKAARETASSLAKSTGVSPAVLAAARAVATACAVMQTPTNALGFTFYGAAAAAYDQAGTEERPEIYDALAEKELAAILASLQDAAVENEPNPVKVDWNC